MGVAYIIGRLLIPILFIVEGIKKALNVAGAAKEIANAKIPVPDEIIPYLGGIPKFEAAAYLVAAVEIICGLMIMVGIAARWGALILFVFTAATTFYFHNFWEMTGDAYALNQIHALKNLSIMGALLLVVAGGSRGTPDGRPQA
jgi:putative oxidoreductase